MLVKRGRAVRALTAKEMEVLTMLAEGLSYKVIARRLGGISHKTIESRRASAMRKMGAKTTEELLQLTLMG